MTDESEHLAQSATERVEAAEEVSTNYIDPVLSRFHPGREFKCAPENIEFCKKLKYK